MSDLETTRCHAWEYFWSIGNFDVFILHPRHGESLKFDGHVPRTLGFLLGGFDGCTTFFVPTSNIRPT